MNQSDYSGNQAFQEKISPSQNGNDSNTTGNTPSGGTNNIAGLQLSHGTAISHRLLIQHISMGRGPWVTDVLFPQEMSGVIDFCPVDEGAAAFLTGLVQAIRPNVALETGTHKGRSTRAIANGLFLNQQGHLWTVDMDDYGLMASGAIRDYEKPFVTQVVGRTPDIFGELPLRDVMNIDFAFIDGDHTKDGLVADLEYVDAHRAENCLVLVDNAKDHGWPDVEAYFKTYRGYHHLLIPTLCGMQMIWMTGYDTKNR